MQQNRLTLLKPVLMAILLVGIAFGCKKSCTNITPTPIDPLQNFVPIPATNSFMMGSPTTEVGRIDSNETQHKVALSGFYMNKYELTIGEFKAFLASKDTNYLPVTQRKITAYTIADWSETDAHPVVNIQWFSTVAYCNWLTKQTGSKDTCYTFTLNGDGTIKTVSFDRTKHGYRLPTEAEWEYACRAETTTAYSFGDGITTRLRDYAWYGYNSGGASHSVGGKKANPFGLRDMHGNVYEWVWDWYPAVAPYYPTVAETNPTGSTTGLTRVFRGGSCENGAADLRSAYRGSAMPNGRDRTIGFRLAKTM